MMNGRKLKRTKDLSDWLDSAYSYLAMANYPYPTSFLMPLPGNPIKEVSWTWCPYLKVCYAFYYITTHLPSFG